MGAVTYVDSGVLIAYHRGPDDQRRRARSVIDDGERRLLVCWLVAAETIPKAVHERRPVEVDLYHLLLSRMVDVPIDRQLLSRAFALGCTHGLSATDAVHAAAALAGGAEELVTSETRTKPLFRLAAEGLSVVSLVSEP